MAAQKGGKKTAVRRRRERKNIDTDREEESRVSGGAFYFSCKSQLIGNILKRETKRLSG